MKRLRKLTPEEMRAIDDTLSPLARRLLFPALQLAIATPLGKLVGLALLGGSLVVIAVPALLAGLITWSASSNDTAATVVAIAVAATIGLLELWLIVKLWRRIKLYKRRRLGYE